MRYKNRVLLNGCFLQNITAKKMITDAEILILYLSAFTFTGILPSLTSERRDAR